MAIACDVQDTGPSGATEVGPFQGRFKMQNYLETFARGGGYLITFFRLKIRTSRDGYIGGKPRILRASATGSENFQSYRVESASFGLMVDRVRQNDEPWTAASLPEQRQ
jgi:hypothetical protein